MMHPTKAVLLYCTPTEAERKAGMTLKKQQKWFAKMARESNLIILKKFRVDENFRRADILKVWQQIVDYNTSRSPDHPKMVYAIPTWMFELVLEFINKDRAPDNRLTTTLPMVYHDRLTKGTLRYRN